MGRSSWRRLGAAVIAGLGVATVLGVAGAPPASASITSPGNGATVRGNVGISESGASDHLTCGSEDSRITVVRLSDGATILSQNKGNHGGWSLTWNTNGQPNGNYRIDSWVRNRKLDWFTCKDDIKTGSITVSLQNRTAISYGGATSALHGDNVNVNATVTAMDNGGYGVSGVPVTFTIGGQGGVTIPTNGSGVAAGSIPVSRSAGGTTITAATSGNANLLGSSVAPGFTVNQRPSAVANTGTLSSLAQATFTASARLYDTANGANLAGRTVSFQLRNGGTVLSSGSGSTNGSGIASATLTAAAPAGNYTLVASYGGETNWVASSVSNFFTIGLRPSALTAGNVGDILRLDSRTVSATLRDITSGNRLAGQNVYFNVTDAGNQSVLDGTVATDGDGVAEFTIADLPAGAYTVSQTFAGNGVNGGTNTAAAFEVLLRPTSLVHSAAASVFRREILPVTATLTDVTTGGVLAGRTVSYSVTDIDSVEVLAGTAGTDENGIASFDIADLAAGSYGITETVDATADYTAASATDGFAVERRPLDLTLAADQSAVSGESVDVTLSAVDNLTATGETNHELTLDLVDVDDIVAVEAIAATTGEDGTVVVTVPLEVPAGAYTLRANAAETADHVAGAASAALAVTLRPTGLSWAGAENGFWNDSYDLSAVLIDDRTGDPLVGEPVEFSVAGDVIGSALTGDDGRATMAFPLTADAGTYAVSAAYAGTDRLEAAATESAFDIVERPTVLSYTGATDGTRGSTVTLSAVLTDGPTGDALEGRTVTFDLGSFTADAVTGADGVATVDVVLDQNPGSYDVVMGFAGEAGQMAGTSTTVPFVLDWEHSFESALGNGVLHINPSTQEFQFVGPGGSTAIVHDAGMSVTSIPLVGDVVVIAYDADSLTVAGEFNLTTGQFAGVVSTADGIHTIAGA